jgi:hypothetical protein
MSCIDSGESVGASPASTGPHKASDNHEGVGQDGEQRSATSVGHPSPASAAGGDDTLIKFPCTLDIYEGHHAHSAPYGRPSRSGQRLVPHEKPQNGVTNACRTGPIVCLPDKLHPAKHGKHEESRNQDGYRECQERPGAAAPHERMHKADGPPGPHSRSLLRSATGGTIESTAKASTVATRAGLLPVLARTDTVGSTSRDSIAAYEY